MLHGVPSAQAAWPMLYSSVRLELAIIHLTTLTEIAPLAAAGRAASFCGTIRIW
jgi:hypothetical protein